MRVTKSARIFTSRYGRENRKCWSQIALEPIRMWISFPALPCEKCFWVETKGHDGDIWDKRKLVLAYCLLIRAILNKLQRKCRFAPSGTSIANRYLPSKRRRDAWNDGKFGTRILRLTLPHVSIPTCTYLYAYKRRIQMTDTPTRIPSVTYIAERSITKQNLLHYTHIKPFDKARFSNPFHCQILFMKQDLLFCEIDLYKTKWLD